MVRAAQATPVQSLARALSGQSVNLARALALTIYIYTHALTRTTIYMVASLALASPRLASHRSPRLTRLATHALASL